MDHEASPPRIIKRRRRHSRRFKEQVVAECQQSDDSVAAVAMRHGLNLNLVHKWRQVLAREDNGEFLRLSPPAAPASSAIDPSEPSVDTVTLKVPTPRGHITVHWPVSQLAHSVDWLKALMQ